VFEKQVKEIKAKRFSFSMQAVLLQRPVDITIIIANELCTNKSNNAASLIPIVCASNKLYKVEILYNETQSACYLLNF
jgi:hypothetical protein